LSTEEAFHHLTDQISSIKVNKLDYPVIQSDMALKVDDFAEQFDSIITLS